MPLQYGDLARDGGTAETHADCPSRRSPVLVFTCGNPTGRSATTIADDSLWPPWHDLSMDLPAPLVWLIDEAAASPDPQSFLAELGSRLLADGLPLAGGALTLATPHPIIAYRTWLWRAETGAVIEALGFVGAPPIKPGATGWPGLDRCGRTKSPRHQTVRCWAGLGPGHSAP